MRVHPGSVVAMFVAVHLAGCGAPDETEEPLGEQEEGLAAGERARSRTGATTVSPVVPPPPPVVNGTFTTAPNWVVQIQAGGCSCSGWAVNEHWILTSGHCFIGTGQCPAVDGDQLTVLRATGLGASMVVYQAPASFIRHPSFAGNAAHDAQLIRLWSHGLPIEVMGQAKMYSDSRKPWKDLSLPRSFFSVGWGRSVINPNDATDCIAGGVNAMRSGGPLTLDSTSTDVPTFVTSPIGTQFPCSGDSGSPWLLPRGSEMLGIAIHSRRAGSPRKAQGTTIADNLSWIESTLAANTSANKYGQWRHDGTAGDQASGFYRYRQCEELWRGWGQLKRDNVCIQANGATAGSTLSAATCGVSTSIATQAFALVPSGAILSLAAPGFCLEASSAADLAPMRVAPCNGSLNQRFGNGPGSTIRLGLDWNRCVASVRNDPWVVDTGGVLTQAALAASPEDDDVELAEDAASTTMAGELSSTGDAATAAANALVPNVFGRPAAILVKQCDGSAAQRWNFQ